MPIPKVKKKEPTEYNTLSFYSQKQPTAENLAKEIKKFGKARLASINKIFGEGYIGLIYVFKFEK